MLTLSFSTYLRKAKVPFREAPGFLVVATPKDTQIEFAGSAPDVWAQVPDALQEPATVETIVGAIAAEVSLPVSDVVAAVLATLQAMVDYGVIDVY